MSLSGTATATEGPRSLAEGSKTGSMAIERGWETGSSTTFARVVERGQRTKAGSNEVLGWQQDIGRDANGLVRTSSTMAKALSEASGLLAAGSTAITRPAHTRMLRTSHVGSYRGVVLRDVTRRITWHAHTIKPSSDQALTQRENKDPMATPSLSLSLTHTHHHRTHTRRQGTKTKWHRRPSPSHRVSPDVGGGDGRRWGGWI